MLFGEAYSIQNSWGVSRGFFESVTLASLAVMILIGIAFWALGTRYARRGPAYEERLGVSEE